MKKKIIAVLLLMSILMIACAACGGNSKEDDATSTAELPTVTPKPASDAVGQTVIAAEDNTGTSLDDISGTAYVSEAHEIAASLVGQDVQVLYDAIGEPNSSNYVVGCYENGDDGYLYYDGFYVTTYRYDTGAEIITGAFADSEAN